MKKSPPTTHLKQYLGPEKPKDIELIKGNPYLIKNDFL